MKKEPKLIFEKWQSPYGEDTDSRDMPNIDVEGENDEPESVNLKDILDSERQVQFLATPLGIVPLTEFTDPGKIFNFFVGHSNFNLSAKIGDIIAKTEGIEAYRAFSPYRCRIAIGKLFEEQEVIEAVKKNVYAYLG